MTALVFGVVVALLLGAAGGALLVWLLAPAPSKPLQPAVPEAPQLPPQDSTLHPVMQQALNNAPELFARARHAAAIRKSMSCSTCSEGTQIVCPLCHKRVCPAHQAVTAHDCQS